MNKYSAILFHSNNYAIWTKKLLKNAKIEHKMISVPRHLSSDCGYCVRILTDDIDKIIPVLKEKGIGYDRIEALQACD